MLQAPIESRDADVRGNVAKANQQWQTIAHTPVTDL
jgi:hypothetical protein